MNIVLIHGFCENDSVWNDLVPLLPKKHHYITPNFSELTHCQKMDDYAKLLNKNLEEADISDVVIIGHSMGGYIGLSFAELFPHKVKGLGLFHSSTYADSDDRKETRLKSIQYIVKHGAKDYIEDFLPSMFNSDFRRTRMDYIRSKVAEYTKRISEEALIAALLAMRERPDRSHIVESADFPTLFIGGGKDKLIPMDATLKQISIAKHINVLISNDIAHAGMLEKPTLCASFLQEFFETCDKNHV